MPLPVAALSFDGDDTLWDFGSGFVPAIAHAARRLTEAGGRIVTVEQLQEVREEMARRMPGADFAEIRRAALAESARRLGCERPGLAEEVYRAFVDVRAEHTLLHPETGEVLSRLAASLPLALTTNGNTDLGPLGLDTVFAVVVRAAECGVHKPDPGIYRITAERLGVPPAQVLHIGDHPLEDVAAAREAGMAAVLLDRTGRTPGALRSLDELPALLADLGRELPAGSASPVSPADLAAG
ncbi:HAD family hydrolase [Kitasatospora sp. NBC_00240]|uniref:HAD family hydrolase n=1 Tax=Kitasatospora sp. NBC_00240 TaxID=2903567 RepID=UPI00225509F1|nr:HAD family hydrolase [Kitasatospora sp. NBC_00240]MCX5214172.1 HAD family hydrolase [Kitasatospora sp. NBC_00240]